MIQGIALAIILIAALAWTGRRVWLGLSMASDPTARSAACRGCPDADSCGGGKESEHDPE